MSHSNRKMKSKWTLLFTGYIPEPKDHENKKLLSKHVAITDIINASNNGSAKLEQSSLRLSGRISWNFLIIVIIYIWTIGQSYQSEFILSQYWIRISNFLVKWRKGEGHSLKSDWPLDQNVLNSIFPLIGKRTNNK